MSYQVSTRYDALNRPVEILHPQDVEGRRAKLEPRYNQAGALERIDLDGHPQVLQIAYNAKGQRILATYDNGVMTRYAYEPRTFRLARLRSERYETPAGDVWHGKDTAIQDFTYS